MHTSSVLKLGKINCLLAVQAPSYQQSGSWQGSQTNGQQPAGSNQWQVSRSQTVTVSLAARQNKHLRCGFWGI